MAHGAGMHCRHLGARLHPRRYRHRRSIVIPAEAGIHSRSACRIVMA
jgi:hypothetical protein